MTETKLAIAINSDNTIHQKIGHIFAIAACKDKQICEITTYNATSNSSQAIIEELKEQGIEAILCKNADYQTLSYLEDLNIQAFRIHKDLTTIEETVAAKLNHKLSPIVKMFTCGGACDF